MPLFLTSTDLKNADVFQTFKSFALSARTVVIVTTAALHYKANNRNVISLEKKIAATAESVHLLDIEFESPAPLLKADLIAIAGGNPYYLLRWLRKSGADGMIQQAAQSGTPIMATSAGAIVLGQSLVLIDQCTPEMNTINLGDKSALGLIDAEVFPHYDRFVKNGLISEKMVSTYVDRTSREVIRLNDDQYHQLN